RRRHTRSKRDWSSDVCSSDLGYTSACRNTPFLSSIRRYRLSKDGPTTSSERPTAPPQRQLQSNLQVNTELRKNWIRFIRPIFSKIGRASCRERMGFAGVGVSI